MRSTLNRSVSCALLFTFVFTQAAPALALRGPQASQQDDPRRKDTLEELTDALHRVGTQVAQAIGWPTPPPQPDPPQVAAGLEGITDFLEYLRLNNLELELGQAHAIYIRHERPEGDEWNEGPIVLTDFEEPEHLQRLGVGGLRLVDIDWDEGLVSLEDPSGQTYRALQAALPPPAAGLEGQEEEEEGEQEEQPVQRMPAVKLRIAGGGAFIRKVTPSVASLQERREREGRQPIYTTWTDDLVTALAAVSSGTVDLLLISMSLREEPMPGLTRRVDDLPLVNNVLELVRQSQENRARWRPPLPPLPIYLIQDPSADVPGGWKESLEQFQKKGWIQGIVPASVLQDSEAFDAFLEGVIPQVRLAHEDFSQPPQAGTDHRPSQPSRPEMVSRVIDDGPPVESTEDSAATTPPRGYARRQATRQKIIQAIEGYEGEYLLTRKAMAGLAGIDVRTLDRYPWRDMVKQENERREGKGQRLIRTNPRGRTGLRKAGTDRADDQAAGLEAAQAPSLEWNPRLIAHSPRPDFSPTQRAGVFGRILRIRGQIERFHRDFPDGIQFDAPRVAATGVLVDLTGSPAEAFASLYLRLPHDARVLVDSEVFGKILGLTDRLPDRDIRFFFKEEEETYAEALQRAIGSLAGVVRVFSTRSREAVLAAAGPHRGRVQTIESRDFRILLANLGAVEDEALEAFLELLRELSGIRRLVEFL